MTGNKDDLRRTQNGKLEVSISFRRVPKPVVVLLLRGEMENEGAQLLKTILDEWRVKSVKYVILDTSSLSKINSAGISILLANKSLSLVGGPQMILVGLSESLRFPLEQLGALPLFSVFESPSSALEFIARD